MSRVLFVCLGNICRSPTAEGIFRHLAEDRGWAGDLTIDSAGTGAYHAGESPDARMTAAAARHGYRLEGAARAVRDSDFTEFDLILAMDGSNLADLEARRPAHTTATIQRFRDFDPEGTGDVPDPYYGGSAGFETVVQMVERTSTRLLDELCARTS